MKLSCTRLSLCHPAYAYCYNINEKNSSEGQNVFLSMSLSAKDTFETKMLISLWEEGGLVATVCHLTLLTCLDVITWPLTE